MKGKIRKMVVMVLSVSALLAAAVCGEPSSEQLSEELLDFQIQINDELYQFPMEYEDFRSLGWLEVHEEEAREEVEPESYKMVSFQREDMVCRVHVMNPGPENCMVSEALIGGMELDTFDWPPELGTVILPGGIRRGEATLEDIKEAYGEPHRIYDGEMYTKYVYEKDFFSEVELSVYHESGVLEDIDLENGSCFQIVSSERR